VKLRALSCAVAVALIALTGCGGDEGPGTVKLYDRAPVPAVPDRTATLGPEAAQLRPDGEYWADLSGASDGDVPTLTFLLTQAFFADACVAELGVDECTNDFGTLDEPSVLVTVSAADVGAVTVAADNRQNFAVTPAELFILAGGGTPSAGAPEGFAYVPFPFLLSVRDGRIVEAHQIWLG
jgi:hypothetical protein